jgi:hypothetical protein
VPYGAAVLGEAGNPKSPPPCRGEEAPDDGQPYGLSRPDGDAVVTGQGENGADLLHQTAVPLEGLKPYGVEGADWARQQGYQPYWLGAPAERKRPYGEAVAGNRRKKAGGYQMCWLAGPLEMSESYGEVEAEVDAQPETPTSHPPH